MTRVRKGPPPTRRWHASRGPPLARLCLIQFDFFRNKCIDVAARLRTRGDLYTPGRATGLNFFVQATVVAQRVAAEILLEAFGMIEDRDLFEFAFACHGATHRSVACAVLLTMMVYPDAQICLTTRRT